MVYLPYESKVTFRQGITMMGRRIADSSSLRHSIPSHTRVVLKGSLFYLRPLVISLFQNDGGLTRECEYIESCSQR